MLLPEPEVVSVFLICIFLVMLAEGRMAEKGTPCQELFLLVGISRMGLASVDVPLGQI